jgi:hypothetical protein
MYPDRKNIFLTVCAKDSHTQHRLDMQKVDHQNMNTGRSGDDEKVNTGQ